MTDPTPPCPPLCAELLRSWVGGCRHAADRLTDAASLLAVAAPALAAPDDDDPETARAPGANAHLAAAAHWRSVAGALENAAYHLEVLGR